LVTGLTRLTWITSGYGWLAIIVPILAASPGFFGGPLTLGGLMVAAGAFTQVQQSLRWFVDNFNTIADWLATLRRVASFRLALVDMEKFEGEAGRIEHSRTNDAKITFDKLSVASPAGSGALDETHAEIAPGERVLITGDFRAGLTTLFRAIAGLWLFGAGRIALPASEELMFVPNRPYLQPGRLREALAYPAHHTAFPDEDLVAACERVALRQLSSELERSANWDNELTTDEAQRLAFARLLLHKPRWVCIDDALDALNKTDREAILSIFDNELAGAAVVSFGASDLREGFSARVLRLTKILEPGA
jgi:putative ATP-binding cassette transporter